MRAYHISSIVMNIILCLSDLQLQNVVTSLITPDRMHYDHFDNAFLCVCFSHRKRILIAQKIAGHRKSQVQQRFFNVSAFARWLTISKRTDCCAL